jgi:ribosomal protein L32
MFLSSSTLRCKGSYTTIIITIIRAIINIIINSATTFKLYYYYYYHRRLRRYHHQLSAQKLTFCEVRTSYTREHFRSADTFRENTFYTELHFSNSTFRHCEKRLLASTQPSVCLSICPHGTTRLPRDRFEWNFIFEYFSKICRENTSFFKIWQE